jgi:hypothetical protein
MMIWAGHVARIKEMRNPYKIIDGKYEGKTPIEKNMGRCVDNIKVERIEIVPCQ